MSSPDTQAAANRFRFLAEAAAWRYRGQGFWVRWMVREKLLRDPLYRELIASNRLPMEGLVLDLGCGRGVFLALLVCLQALGRLAGGKRGAKPRLMGLELRPDAAESARLALAGEAEIITGDVRSVILPPCRAVILQDVLLFLEPEEQDRLLERITSSLELGGFVILREPDAGAFVRRAGIRIAASAFGLFRGKRRMHLYPRSGVEWKRRLESLGLQVESIPMKTGPGFMKALFLARKT